MSVLSIRTTPDRERQRAHEEKAAVHHLKNSLEKTDVFPCLSLWGCERMYVHTKLKHSKPMWLLHDLGAKMDASLPIAGQNAWVVTRPPHARGRRHAQQTQANTSSAADGSPKKIAKKKQVSPVLCFLS